MWVAGRRDARLRRTSPFAGKVFAGPAAVRLAAMAPDAEDVRKCLEGKSGVGASLERAKQAKTVDAEMSFDTPPWPPWPYRRDA